MLYLPLLTFLLIYLLLFWLLFISCFFLFTLLIWLYNFCSFLSFCYKVKFILICLTLMNYLMPCLQFKTRLRSSKFPNSIVLLGGWGIWWKVVAKIYFTNKMSILNNLAKKGIEHFFLFRFLSHFPRLAI